MAETVLAVMMQWNSGYIPVNYHMSLLGSDIRIEPRVMFIRTASPNPEIGGNRAIKYALDQGATELLFTDVDQTVPPDILKRFRAHNKQVVGALTPSRSQAGHPWLLQDYTKDGRWVQAEPIVPLQRCGYIGPGCMLVKAEVFRKVKPPWWFTTATADGSEFLMTCDFNFFHKCAEAGIEVFCDTTVVSEHQYELYLNAANLSRNLPRIEAVGNASVAELHSEGIPCPAGIDQTAQEA